jgi:hypothetical protein
MAKTLPCKPFPLPPWVVRGWHRPCSAVREARRWHDHDEIDISSEPRAHHTTWR